MATTLLEPAVTPQVQPTLPAPDISLWLARLTIAAVAAGILWRVVRYLMQFPIWGDEAYVSLNFIDRGFWEMANRLEYNQVAPIVFLWVEWLAYHTMGPSELSLHLFPLLAGVAGLLLFWRFARLALPPLAASLAVSILAVSYYPVRHATEIKPYSFDLLMAMALLLPALHWLRAVNTQRKQVTLLLAPQVPAPTCWLAILTFVTPLALASSYPAVFVAGGVSLVLLPSVWRSKSRAVWGWYVAFNLAMVGTFLAHVKLVGGEQLDTRADVVLHNYWKDWFPPANVLELPFWLLKVHTGAMMAYPVGGAHGGSTLTLLLCLAGIWALWQARQRQLVMLCLVPFGLSLLAAFVHRYPYGGSARLAQHLAPAICILMGCGIKMILDFRLKKADCGNLNLQSKISNLKSACCVLAGLVGIALCGMVWNVAKPTKVVGDEQIRKLLREVAGKAQPTDRIVVFEHPDALRPNMIWYLRMVGLPIVWQGEADWQTLAAGKHGVWGFSVKGEPAKAGGPTFADMSRFTLVERREVMFEADSKDVPRQYCQVSYWVPK